MENNHKVIKRGQKNNDWLYLLKNNDKLDVYDNRKKGDKCWHIGTVIKIETNCNKQVKLLISYTGWRSEWDEWINIDELMAISSKLRKLHAITPYHDYLTNPTIKPCKWKQNRTWKKCIICDKKCCAKCYITKNDKCKTCMKTVNYQNLFNPIYDSIYNQYAIDINIICLITEYSMGITVQCSNTNDLCLNEINLESQYDLERNLYQNQKKCTMWKRPHVDIKVYQYCTKYIVDGTTAIYGKNRRIFCKSCRKQKLKICSKCRVNREVKIVDYASNVCHNCHYSEESAVSVHYSQCDRCYLYGSIKCKQCNKYFCDDCMEYQKDICAACYKYKND